MLQNCQFENVNKINQLLSPSLFREACPTDENQNKKETEEQFKRAETSTTNTHTHTNTQASESENRARRTLTRKSGFNERVARKTDIGSS